LKILVGLGNPGKEHFRNRHNLGFLVVDAWVQQHGATFNKEEFMAATAKIKLGSEDVLCMKPSTYMNRSGEAVAQAMQFYKVEIEDVIVVHDELDIPPMTSRIKRGGGAGGHNGLRSIIALGDSFLRFRMGVGRPEHPGHDIADYVLGNLNATEWEFWEKNIKNVCDAIDLCLQGQVDQAMNRYNRKA
jgi:PTH1 family peptidyl-tRNA hydrolase